jgi:hypothetical protein
MTLELPIPLKARSGIAAKARTGIAALTFAAAVMPLPAMADTFVFNTGNPDGLMATAVRPESPGKFEIEAGDDFVLTQQTLITGAAFTGLIPLGASTSDIKNVVVEVYRVFPADSDVGRTSGPPTFSTPNVPTRVNSPSDVALDERQFSAGSPGLTAVVQSNQPFTAKNSVQPGGIHPAPNQTTGGNGPVTGQETVISVNLTTPFDLLAGQYFFVPQVELSNGDFFWLSAPRPGTPSPPASPIFRAGHEMTAMEVSRPIGCGSAPTSLAPLRQRVQRLTRPLCSTA